MKRSTLLSLTLATLLALNAAPALAGKNDKKSKKQNQNQQQNQSQKQLKDLRRPFNLQSPLSNSANVQQTFKKHKKPHDQKPIDPGRGDGRVPVEPVTPQGPPGFVFVDGHWQRAKAQKSPQVIQPQPTQATVVVRDHRERRPGGRPSPGQLDPSKAPGGVIVSTPGKFGPQKQQTTIFNPTGDKTWTVAPTVRDHRTIKPPPVASGKGGSLPAGGANVRDHRGGAGGSGGMGGVTVTPGGGRQINEITGSGPNPLDLLMDGVVKVGNVFGIGYGEITSGNGSAPSGPVVNDHRSPRPPVRDHRSK